MRILFRAVILVLIGLLIPGEGMAVIAIVSHTSAGSSDQNVVTTPGIDTSGSTLIVLVTSRFGNTVPTVTDSNSNTWTPRTSYGRSGDAHCQIFYCVNPSVGSGHTFTLTDTGNLPGIAVIALSGTDTSAPYDVENGGTGNGAGATTQQVGNITPSVDNEILITGVGAYSGTINSIDSGFTILENVVETANHLQTGLAYLIQTTATAENPTWTFGASDVVGLAIASFKASSGGGATPAVMPSMNMLGVGGQL